MFLVKTKHVSLYYNIKAFPTAVYSLICWRWDMGQLFLKIFHIYLVI